MRNQNKKNTTTKLPPTAGDQPRTNETKAPPTAGEKPAANEANAQPTAGEQPTAGDPSPEDELSPLQRLLKNKNKKLLTTNDVYTLMNTIEEWMVTPDALRIIQLLGATVVETDDALARANKQYGDLHSGTRAFMQAGEALKKENAAFRIKYSELLKKVAEQRQDKGDHLVADEEHDQLKEKLARLTKENAQLQKRLANKQVTGDSHKSSATTPDTSASSATSTEPPVNVALQSSIQSIIQEKQRQATYEHRLLSARIDAFTAQKDIIVQKLPSASAADSLTLADELKQVLHDHMLAELQLVEVSTTVAAFTNVHIPSLLEACVNLIDAASQAATTASTAASAPAATGASTPASTVAPTPASTPAPTTVPTATPATTAAAASTPYKDAVKKK